MITIGPYTFADEAERKADYRRRVGPMQALRTVERPDPDMTLADWLSYIHRAYLERV